MTSIIVMLPEGFEQEKQALACLEAAGMLTQVEIRFEYHPGDDDAPERTP